MSSLRGRSTGRSCVATARRHPADSRGGRPGRRPPRARTLVPRLPLALRRAESGTMMGRVPDLERAMTEPKPTPPTMYLPMGCKPSKACSHDETRPALTHAYLRQHDDAWWVCATDSYIAVAIKVDVTCDVREGWIPRPALKMMEAHETVRDAEQVSDSAWKVPGGDGASFVVSVEPVSLGKPPDLAVLGMWDAEPGMPILHIGMDPRLTRRVQKALGATTGLRMEFTTYGKAESPIRIRPVNSAGGLLALQMPVRLIQAR